MPRSERDENEAFRAALAEALALAKDPRHVIALSRVYAHAVGAIEPTTDVSARFRELDVNEADRRIRVDLDVDEEDEEEDEDAEEEDDDDFDEALLESEEAAADDDDDEFEEDDGLYATEDATEAILEYEDLRARRGGGARRGSGGRSPQRASLETALRDREREYRQLLARASAETARGESPLPICCREADLLPRHLLLSYYLREPDPAAARGSSTAASRRPRSRTWP